MRAILLLLALTMPVRADPIQFLPLKEVAPVTPKVPRVRLTGILRQTNVGPALVTGKGLVLVKFRSTRTYRRYLGRRVRLMVTPGTVRQVAVSDGKTAAVSVVRCRSICAVK